jgi:lysophospholipase L1-like esterase
MGSLVVSLLIAELMLRARDWYETPPRGKYRDYDSVFEFSPTRHHRLVPSVGFRHKELEYDYVWANNALGMRDRERSPKKNPGSFRILFLGDSIIQGYGVSRQQSMVARLEVSLNEPRREKTVEVLNGGVFGYSPLLEYLYLREISPLVEPDMVMVGFFLGNDVGDACFSARQKRVKKNGDVFFNDKRWPWSDLNELIDKTSPGTLKAPTDSTNRQAHGEDTLKLSRKLKSWVFKSRLARSIKEARDRVRERRQYEKRREREEAVTRQYQEDIRINLGLVNYPVLDPEQRLKFWQISESYLTDMSRLCRERGIPLILIVIPGGGPPDFAEPYEILNQLGRQLSVLVIHLLPGFVSRPYNETHYPLDGHWNPEGNRLAATIIDRELRPLNLLPPVSRLATQGERILSTRRLGVLSQEVTR